MPLARLFGFRPEREAAYRLYGAVVDHARQPVFFAERGVPDTLDGRFELIALHAFLALNRLKAEHARTAGFAQEVFDAMFADLDRALREMGTGDLSVGKQVKRMATAFYGRILSYERGLEPDAAPDVLEEALRRNLYGTATPAPADVAAMAAYLRAAAAALRDVPVDGLLAGRIGFPPPPSGSLPGDSLPGGSVPVGSVPVAPATP